MPDTANVLSQRWTDILPPVAPESMLPWLGLSSAVLALLVVLVVVILWQQRPRQRALRVLRRCRKQLAARPGDSRRISYTLYHTVLQGLGLHPARELHTPALTDANWQRFYRELQHCVFQPTPPTAAELTVLIWQGRYWLRHYPDQPPQ